MYKSLFNKNMDYVKGRPLLNIEASIWLVSVPACWDQLFQVKTF